jgi:cytochrome bd-type quinol oxidase subunit 1
MRVPLAVALIVVWLIPSLATAEDRGLLLPTLAASAAAAADWGTTYHGLSNYHLRESNPLLRPFESSPRQLVVMGAMMDGVALSAWNLTIGQRYPRAASAGLWAMAAFRGYLAIHNIRNMRRAPLRDR